MRLLLDTHVALWAIAKRLRLPVAVRDMIGDPANDVVVSAVSVWEIAIKHALARGRPSDMPISGADALAYFLEAGFELLDVSADHAAAVERLPPLHGDPFDRLLVAQALSEPLRLVTHDARLAAHSDTAILF
ncbi:MAG: type II toxin-antitoxin system VapC family toxin [Caulobacteraceae bacterium]